VRIRIVVPACSTHARRRTPAAAADGGLDDAQRCAVYSIQDAGAYAYCVLLAIPPPLSLSLAGRPWHFRPCPAGLTRRESAAGGLGAGRGGGTAFGALSSTTSSFPRTDKSALVRFHWLISVHLWPQPLERRPQVHSHSISAMSANPVVS
jgi:hypothetical protein